MIYREAVALIDTALEMGDGDACVGQMRAVERGALDIPISAWNGVKDNVVAVRDSHGAVRYLNPGRLPLPREVLDHHKARVDERKSDSGLRDDIAMVVHDIRRYMTD